MKYYLSKNYNETTSAGNKAKTDIECILSQQGYKNAGLVQTTCSSKIIGFILTFAGVMKLFFTVAANDIVVLQYPFKKYYSFVCNIVHFKKGKVITIIHDLGTFRRKKLTAKKEIRRLNHSDVLIIHNNNMKAWLLQQSFSKPMVCFDVFDYLSASENNKPRMFHGQPLTVVYAGSLSYRKNKFLYDLEDRISKWQFVLYGSGFDENRIRNKSHFRYNGFVPSDRLIEQVDAHFGLVWDGDSPLTCSGNFGDYLRLNKPHKASLYIRCNLPLIVWEESALATFVTGNKIGFSIRSLTELDTVLPALTVESYEEMKKNVRKINKQIAAGYYMSKVLNEAIKCIHPNYSDDRG
jgi:hypothetical protein